MTKHQQFRGSRFVGGDWHNGFNLQFDVADDGSVSVTFAFADHMEGPPNIVHGGALSAVIDEAITVAAFVNDRGGFTANLNINYKAPVPIGETVIVKAKIDKIVGRKTFLSSTLHLVDRTLAVSATGLFISI